MGITGQARCKQKRLPVKVVSFLQTLTHEVKVQTKFLHSSHFIYN